MRILWLVVALFMSSCMQHGFASDGSAPHDKGVRCVSSTGGFCALPIFALYSCNLGRYAGLQVVTSGFLRKIGHDFLLFVDEGQARFAVPEQAFSIVDLDGAFQETLNEGSGAYVQVVGEIREPEHSPYWAEIVLTRSPQIVPVNIGDTYPPAPPPSDIQDRIRVEGD